MTSVLSFRILASPSSNDHEARPLVDGADWLEEDCLGLDPPELVLEFARDPARLLIGRCGCGVVGCGDVTVEVERTESTVEWRRHDGSPITFDRRRYDAEIARFSTDHSWEPLERRVEREVGQVFAGSSTKAGLTFDWASTRIRQGLICLSYSRRGVGQRLLEFGWDGQNLDDALTSARRFHAEHFDDSSPK